MFKMVYQPAKARKGFWWQKNINYDRK